MTAAMARYKGSRAGGKRRGGRGEVDASRNLLSDRHLGISPVLLFFLTLVLGFDTRGFKVPSSLTFELEPSFSAVTLHTAMNK